MSPLKRSDFEELTRLEKLVKRLQRIPNVKIDVPATVNVKGSDLPIYSITMGSEEKTLPTFGLFSGVHGLEKVGTHLVVHFFRSLMGQIQWDETLFKRFESVRLVSIPLINPGGMLLTQRSNPNGVDLMRNAPIEAKECPAFLLGGHQISSKLPWYRGNPHEQLEIESQTLIDFVKKELFQAKVALSLDVHSGFGVQDQLWYPYAKTKEEFPLKKRVDKIQSLLKTSYHYHVYKVEPQSKAYTTHGDLWDYLFDEHFERYQGKEKSYIPWTLEMGSWLWLKKNPRQIFSSLGPFNPILPHRYKRIMRRHSFLLNFFLRLTQHHPF